MNETTLAFNVGYEIGKNFQKRAMGGAAAKGLVQFGKNLMMAQPAGRAHRLMSGAAKASPIKDPRQLATRALPQTQTGSRLGGQFNRATAPFAI